MMNKRGEENNILLEYVIFFILLIIFVSAILIFGNRASKQTDNIEALYAKQIALIIDNSKSGLKVNLDISPLFEDAIENNFDGDIITINNDENYVLVKVNKGAGNKYYFFSDNDILWSIDTERAILSIEVT